MSFTLSQSWAFGSSAVIDCLNGALAHLEERMVVEIERRRPGCPSHTYDPLVK